MKLLSVNIGAITEMPESVKSSGKTGIFKQPASGSVRVSENGVDGDTIVDKENHGGVDQAVYVYGGADYAWWSSQLDQPLAPGTFGENLTISDLESAPLRIGDRLHVGLSLVLEVTAPRIPCATFAYKMGDPQWVKRFQKGERPGVYCCVIEAGDVCADDVVTLEPFSGETVTVLEIYRYWYEKDDDQAFLRRALNAPVAVRVRRDYGRKLAALSQSSV